MSLLPCRECTNPVSTDAPLCPKCGAPRPSDLEWNGAGYEFRSANSIAGLPLVHIAFGMDRAGKVRTARGIVAVGQRAIGVVSCGILSLGVVSLGVVSGGVISGGVVAVGLLLAGGVNALAPAAFGVVACGGIVGGVNAIGWKILFSVSHPIR